MKYLCLVASMKKTILISAALAAAAFTLNAEHGPDHKMGKRPGRGPGMKKHGMMFEKMDTDKDGKISKQEWQAHHEKMFSELDGDSDGSITKEEMKAMDERMMAKHGKMKEREEEKGKRKDKNRSEKKDQDDEEKEEK